MGCCGESEKASESLARKRVCCTDVIFLFIFTAFLAGMGYITWHGVKHGDAGRLLYGYDSYGNTCNKQNANITNVSLSGYDTTHMKYLFYMNAEEPATSLRICINKCPYKQLDNASDVQDFYNTSALCRYDIEEQDYGNSSLHNNSGHGPCPVLPVQKQKAISFRCVPDSSQKATDGFASELASQIYADFATSWVQIASLCLIGFVLSLVMMLLIRFLAAIIVWVVVIVVFFGSIGGTVFLWWTYWKEREDVLLWVSILATVFALIMVLLILVMRKRFKLVVALFKEAGKCVMAMPFMLIQPFWTFVVLLTFVVYWVVALTFIMTSGEMVENTTNTTGSYEFVEFVAADTNPYFVAYHVVGLIWMMTFITACQDYVIVGGIALWFFTRDKGKRCTCLIATSAGRLVLHHIGSVAFGSFIILLVKIPRYILMYISAKLSLAGNSFARCASKCCVCCLWCVEKLLKFLNQNAYTVIAIKGKSFCPAAKEAFSIIVNNALRVAAINSVGAFVLFLGKIGVAASTCAIAVIWISSSDLKLNYPAGPVILVTVVTYIIADCFLSVYGMVVDALLICFCIDSSLNDGSDGREYYMSRSLMKFVKDSDQAIKRYDAAQKQKEKDGEGGKDDVEMQAVSKNGADSSKKKQ